mmetsp:Transcript_1076/g.3043  ORF Transcript_1076/g.3043 Transcript_1076/m.3043 type:complete len:300 (+) Transcript_1076:61-960(+)
MADDLQAHLRRRGLGPKGAERPAQVEGMEQETFQLGYFDRKHRQISAAFGPPVLFLGDALVGLAALLAAVCAHLGHWRAAQGSLLAAALLAWRVLPCLKAFDKKDVRVVCISDTHGAHRELKLPEGDLLIHAGDFTRFGKLSDAEDFNAWLATLPFAEKVVVNGNHENNADWQADMESIITNAHFLKNSGVNVCGLRVFGTDFCWPMKTHSPLYALIPWRTEIVVAHGPARGFVDNNMGCKALLWRMGAIRPKLVVSGHIHEAHGVRRGIGTLRGTTFVNAANCRGGYKVGWEPIVINL